MCNLYSHVKGPKAIRDLANAMGGEWLDNAGNLEPQASEVCYEARCTH